MGKILTGWTNTYSLLYNILKIEGCNVISVSSKTILVRNNLKLNYAHSAEDLVRLQIQTCLIALEYYTAYWNVDVHPHLWLEYFKRYSTYVKESVQYSIDVKRYIRIFSPDSSYSSLDSKVTGGLVQLDRALLLDWIWLLSGNGTKKIKQFTFSLSVFVSVY